MFTFLNDGLIKLTKITSKVNALKRDLQELTFYRNLFIFPNSAYKTRSHLATADSTRINLNLNTAIVLGSAAG